LGDRGLFKRQNAAVSEGAIPMEASFMYVPKARSGTLEALPRSSAATRDLLLEAYRRQVER
jgi:hypothetical protein